MTRLRSFPLGRCLLASALAGLWTFLGTLGTFSWLTPDACNLAIVLTFVFVFAFPNIGARDTHHAKDSARLPRSGLFAFLLTQASLLLGLGLLTYLLMLRPEGSLRSVGIPLEDYNPRTPGAVLVFLMGLSVLGLGALVWRDWYKRMPDERRWQRGTLALLVVSGLVWLFLLLSLCVPSIFLDVIAE